jgi:type III pantothenate kinase
VLLAIDIGNTNVGLGLFDGATLRHTWQLAADARRTPDETGLLVTSCLRHAGRDPAQVSAVVVASVVPPLEQLYLEVAARYLSQPAWLITHEADLGIVNRTVAPEQVGIDRLVTAAAAFAMYGGPLVVVDFGTATTIDAVSARGEYLGGAIAPGLVTAHEALVSRTAKLPPIPLVLPERAIGRTTREAMQAGLMFGYVGLIEGLVRRVQAELGVGPVVATGGLAPTMARASALDLRVEPYLALEGIRLVHERRCRARRAVGG